MGMVTTAGQPREYAEIRERSADSRAFEEFWLKLRGSRLRPKRSDFNIARGARFMRDLVLMEAPSPDRRAMIIRLAGERYQEIAGYNLAGTDHLDLLTPELHDGALSTGWMMITQPCGLWQITPMHTPKGFGQYIEVTAFPLGAGDDNIALLLCHVRLTGVLIHSDAGRFAMDTASAFHFIDVGAGVPELAA